MAVAAAGLALLLPAQAQFWDWGGRPQRQQQYYNNNNNWFGGQGQGGWWGQDRRYPEREAPVDYSRAPPPSQSQKKPEATTSIVVMGDANADWLAYGLEDAFSESPRLRSCASTAPIPASSATTRAATSSGRRWRARSSPPRSPSSSS